MNQKLVGITKFESYNSSISSRRIQGLNSSYGIFNVIINLRSCMYIKIQLTEDGQNLSVHRGEKSSAFENGKHEVNRVIHKLRRFLIKKFATIAISRLKI